MSFVKLSQMVGQQFKVVRVDGYSFKSWDAENKKMNISPTYIKGYQKVWNIETDKGSMGVSESLLGQMAVATMTREGKSEIGNKTFLLKSNGKSGKDIRYFVNLVREPVEEEPPVEEDEVPF